MPTLSRNWVTPLMIGAFALMAVTGLLMFFHLDQGLQKEVHEWLGWLLVLAAVLHVTVNWLGFKRYFTAARSGLAAVAVMALVVVGSFFVSGEEGEGVSPPVAAMHAVAGAPLKDVAPLTGRPASQLRAELAASGIELASDEQSIGSVVGNDRERMGRAMRVLFPNAPKG